MIVALAGRRIDAEGADYIRFPINQVPTVRRRLVQSLRGLGCQMLICSGACGADLLALSVAANLGINRRMILPFKPMKFRSISVVDRPGEWGGIFDEIYKEIANQHCVDQLDLDPENPSTYALTNEIIIEKALELAKKQEQKATGQMISGLVVWEGNGYGPNDTTDLFRQQARNRGLNVHEVITL